MEDSNSTVLPYILETLSRKPELCDTFDHLCRDIKEVLDKESDLSVPDVRGTVERAVSVGQNLGILSLTNEMVRVPFRFNAKSGKAPELLAALRLPALAQPAIGTGNPPTTDKKGGGNAASPAVASPSMQSQAPGKNGDAKAASGSTINSPSDWIMGPPPVPIPVQPPRRRIVRARTPMRRRRRSRNRRTTRRRRSVARRRSMRTRSRKPTIRSGYRRRRY